MASNKGSKGSKGSKGAKGMKSRAKARRTHDGMQKELRAIGQRLDAVAADARKAEAGVRAATLGQLRALQRKQAAAQRALAKLGRQSVAASGPLLVGLQKAWHDIERSVRQAARRFGETA